MPTSSYVSTPEVRLAGDLASDLMRDLLELSVEEHIAGLCSLEARMIAWGANGTSTGYKHLDRSDIDFGKPITVGFGTDATTPLFRGTISALQADYPPSQAASLAFCAEDALWDLRMKRQTRTFDDSSTSDIAQRIASDHSLTPQVDLDGPNRTVVNQVNLSDLAFLRQLAYADGAEVWVDDTTLHVQRRSDRDAGSVTLTYGGDLTSFSARADLAHQVTDVHVTGWSVADKSGIDETGDADALGSDLASGDTSGSATLAAAFSERHEYVAVAGPLATDDAQARARAAYLDRARRFVTAQGSTAGTPALRVGTRVTVAGVGGLFNGEYRAVRVRHRFNLVAGYTTDFDLERAGIGSAS
ncbi:hypothetical protein GCM10028801_38080 [Nocardioides maradonensis]